jgi:uncharacterized protein
MTTQRTSIVSPGRIQDVDVLRGFALLGILIVNITFAASGYPIHVAEDPAYSSGLDHAVRWLSSALFDMKFYLLFSFLFGYSFTLQMTAAERAGAAFRPRMLRRLAGLFGLGALNMVFLITGDILAVYALLGLVLLAMRGVRDRTALVVAAAMYGYLLVIMVPVILFVDSSSFFDPAAALAAGRETTQNLAGGPGAVIGEHLRALPLFGLSQLTVQGPTCLAMFLVGLVAGRRRVLAGRTGREPLLARIQLVGFPVGLAGGMCYATAGGNGDTAAVLISALTAPFLAAAYGATLLRLLHGARGRSIGSALAPAGRMALSNYLGQSVATLLIFTGIGFGLVGRVSPLAMVAIAVMIFAGQALISHWWLGRFRQGPAEWVLRWITNGERPGDHPKRANKCVR